MRNKRGVTNQIPESVLREKLELFRVRWCRHMSDCAKVNGGGQLALGEAAVTQVSAQACTCGLWREWEELLWMLFPVKL